MQMDSGTVVGLSFSIFGWSYRERTGLRAERDQVGPGVQLNSAG